MREDRVVDSFIKSKRGSARCVGVIKRNMGNWKKAYLLQSLQVIDAASVRIELVVDLLASMQGAGKRKHQKI